TCRGKFAAAGTDRATGGWGCCQAGCVVGWQILSTHTCRYALLGFRCGAPPSRHQMVAAQPGYCRFRHTTAQHLARVVAGAGGRWEIALRHPLGLFLRERTSRCGVSGATTGCAAITDYFT